MSDNHERQQSPLEDTALEQLHSKIACRLQNCYTSRKCVVYTIPRHNFEYFRKLEPRTYTTSFAIQSTTPRNNIGAL